MKRILLLTLTLASLAACERRSEVPNVELIQDMMEDKSFKAQDYDMDKPDKRANMLPPEHTNPMNWTPYPNFKNDEEAKNFKNPLQENKDWLAKGEHKFQIYCGACHGPQGYGNGLVAKKMLVPPPSLMSAKIRGWTDGQIFHLATKGRGMMGGYESQIPDANERWAIVLYIRHLQKDLKDETPAAAAPATPEKK